MKIETVTRLVVTTAELAKIVRYSQDEAMAAVAQDGYALRYVKEQTEAVCLKAVERDGYALQYVHEQTEAVCLKAVAQNGDALRYVDRKLVVVKED